MKNTSISIERATMTDLEAVQKLNQELCSKENREFDQTIDPNYAFTKRGEEYFRERIESSDAFVLIVRQEGVPAAYLVGAKGTVEDYRKDGITIAELENMYVSESMRGKGIGSELVEKFDAWCRQRSIQIIRIVASAGNSDAIRFYERFGAKPVCLTLEKELRAE